MMRRPWNVSASAERMRRASRKWPGRRLLLLWRKALLDVAELLQRRLLLQEAVVDPACIERAARLVWELIEIREKLLDLALDRHQQPHVAGQELDGASALLHAPLIGIHAEIGDIRPGWLLPKRRC